MPRASISLSVCLHTERGPPGQHAGRCVGFGGFRV
jgi:hypothetical protein